MIKKLTFISIILFSLQSCFLKDVYDAIDMDDAEVTNGEIPFVVERNKMILDMELAGKSERLLFDTGASQHYLSDSLLFNIGEDSVRLKKAGVTLVPGSDPVKSKIGTFELKSPLVNGKTISGFHVPLNYNPCSNIKGVFSLINFIDYDKKVLLDFKENKIKISDSVSLDGYTALDTEFSFSGVVKVKLSINGKEDWFLMDTGADGSVFYPLESEELTSKKYVSSHAISYAKKERVLREMCLYSDVKLTIGGSDYFCDVSNTGNKDLKTIGFAFIKNFNWIIDTENEKVYYQKRSSNNHLEKIENDFFIKNKNGALEIIVKNKENDAYQLGDQIDTVNGVKITSENICEMQKLLTETKDWTTLDITIKK